jgi:hypothetical protein
MATPALRIFEFEVHQNFSILWQHLPQITSESPSIVRYWLATISDDFDKLATGRMSITLRFHE